MIAFLTRIQPKYSLPPPPKLPDSILHKASIAYHSNNPLKGGPDRAAGGALIGASFKGIQQPSSLMAFWIPLGFLLAPSWPLRVLAFLGFLLASSSPCRGIQQSQGASSSSCPLKSNSLSLLGRACTDTAEMAALALICRLEAKEAKER